MADTDMADALGRGPENMSLEALYDVPVKLSAVLGKTTMQVNQLLKLGRGAVIELDRKVGEPIDIYVKDRLVAMKASVAPTAIAAMASPSTMRYGSRRINVRSLNVAGSPSAALTTTYTVPLPASRTDAHFRAVGKPLPPRPRKPLSATSSRVVWGPIIRAVRSPAPPPTSKYCSTSSMGCDGSR